MALNPVHSNANTAHSPSYYSRSSRCRMYVSSRPLAWARIAKPILLRISWPVLSRCLYESYAASQVPAYVYFYFMQKHWLRSKHCKWGFQKMFRKFWLARTFTEAIETHASQIITLPTPLSITLSPNSWMGKKVASKGATTRAGFWTLWDDKIMWRESWLKKEALLLLFNRAVELGQRRKTQICIKELIVH